MDLRSEILHVHKMKGYAVISLGFHLLGLPISIIYVGVLLIVRREMTAYSDL